MQFLLFCINYVPVETGGENTKTSQERYHLAWIFMSGLGREKKKKADTWKRSGGAFKLQILCSDWYLHQMETIAHFTFQFLGSKFRAFDLRGTKALLSLPCFGFVVYFYLWLYRGSYQVPSINMWAHICDFFSENFRRKGKALQTTLKKKNFEMYSFRNVNKLWSYSVTEVR